MNRLERMTHLLVVLAALALFGLARGCAWVARSLGHDRVREEKPWWWRG